MSVESFDPGEKALALGEDVVNELLSCAGALESEGFGLSKERITELAAIARHAPDCDWAGAASPLESAEIITLVRLFTLAERLPGWEAGARSPVIPLVAELKGRGDYPAELTTWIKSNTDNRFLPYGSLLDRL